MQKTYFLVLYVWKERFALSFMNIYKNIESGGKTSAFSVQYKIDKNAYTFGH